MVETPSYLSPILIPKHMDCLARFLHSPMKKTLSMLLLSDGQDSPMSMVAAVRTIPLIFAMFFWSSLAPFLSVLHSSAETAAASVRRRKTLMPGPCSNYLLYSSVE